MKSRLLLTSIALLVASSAFGAVTETPAQELIDRYNQKNGNTLEWLGICVAIALFLVTLQVFSLRKVVTRLQKTIAGETTIIKATWWQVFHIKGKQLDQDADSHEYDGIKEYDNNPPAWFNWLFYGTAIWAVLYLLYFHIFNFGKLPAEEYAEQQKEAEKIVAAAQERAIRFADEPPYADKEHIALGQKTFVTLCATCHGDKAQGLAGPNLTDEYWLHGGAYRDIFKTVFNGVPEKGMPAWKTSLQPEELRAVASYLNSIRNTNQPSILQPQGEKYIGDETAMVK